MEITIHYKGKLDTADLIEPFCAEVEDIAKSMDWEITFINDHLKKEKQNLIGLIMERGFHLFKKMESFSHFLNEH